MLFQGAHFGLPKALWPQKLTGFLARVLPANAGDEGPIRLVPHGQAQVRPVVGFLGQDMAGQILFAQALLDHDECTLLGVVQAGAERAVPPFDSGFDGGFAEGFLGCVGVIYHDDVAAFAGQRGAYGG